MTAEVALLNKTAIALAADSATTVTYWDKNESKTRYFKGANKVFNLSRYRPVGVMTFAAASLNGVPWEIIIKAYREHLDANSHDHLSEYAADFFNFITTNTLLFPPAVQEQQFVALADRTAAMVTLPVTGEEDFDALSSEDKTARIAKALAQREGELAGIDFIPSADQKDVDEAVTKMCGAVTKAFHADGYYKRYIPTDEMERLAKLAIASVFKSDFAGQGTTGLAFAGFGESEYFPRLEQYRCYGLILGKSYFKLEEKIDIDHSNAADVMALAQSNMIDTFIHGASFPTMSAMHEKFIQKMNDLEEKLREAGHLAAETDISAIKEEIEVAFRKEAVRYYHEEHRRPLSRVIANLPINELAELAETLVYIESLKERVTTPAESVSGPIDVAVISKHDGFIWIKRKHYFKQELNHRYFFNQQKEA